MDPAPCLDWLDDIDSTNAEAFRRLDSGALPPFWIGAHRQTRGRGRRGRAWSSVPGNLFLSGAHRLSGPLGDIAQLGFAAALAIGEAVDVLAPGAEVALKWPNDVLIGGRKVAGVLLESRKGGHGVDLVTGVGINLIAAPEPSEPGALAATFVGAYTPQTGERLTPQTAAALFVAGFERWRGVWARSGFEPLRRAWLERASGLGAPIRARLAAEVVSGRFVGLDDDGALMLDGVHGRRLVRSGEVYFPDSEA